MKLDEERRLPAQLDRPTPFTRRGLFVQRASKRRPIAVIAFKTIQARYLEKLATGGVRRPRGRALLVPVNQRRNQYGNMTRGTVARLLAKKDVFSGAPGGSTNGSGQGRRTGGIYQRLRNGRLRLLVAYADRATYEKQLTFRRDARRQAERVLPAHLARRLAQAWESRRR